MFKINEKEIFIIFDIEGNIWFKFKDVLKVLGYTSTLKQSNIFNIDNNFQKNTLFINESGLYYVLSKSLKPLAKVFMDKYFKEIMPEIRKICYFHYIKSKLCYLIHFPYFSSLLFELL